MPKIPGVSHKLAIKALGKAGFKVNLLTQSDNKNSDYYKDYIKQNLNCNNDLIINGIFCMALTKSY